MTDWNPNQYMQFSDDRTRAAIDLCNRVPLENPCNIIDLGCGPGNSTRILHNRWSKSELTGIDSSTEMIAAARKLPLPCEWLLADIAQWEPLNKVDLIFSNAVLQWLPNHDVLVPRLMSYVSPGGVLAFQIPSHHFPAVRKLIFDISRRPVWNDRLRGARNALSRRPPHDYYDLLCLQADHLDVWEAEYYHIMDSAESVIQWISSTGLRPFLADLNSDTDRATFLAELREQTTFAYPKRLDGKVLFPFRRTFVVARRRP
ncbi:methyltransferase domain-containing protein [Schlesneria sp. T3-172]|uniref:methyltransferase domain-containing protein n=1 Tax=Schlesneria sphaerica TaxID=3373610 RepID=UPI0037CBD483